MGARNPITVRSRGVSSLSIIPCAHLSFGRVHSRYFYVNIQLTPLIIVAYKDAYFYHHKIYL
jgi:hypothetical protein